MSNTDLVTAVVVIGRKAGKSDGLLPGDLPDLGHAYQDCNGSRRPDAVDAVDQIEPLGKVGVLADRRDQSLEFDLFLLLQAGDVLLPNLLDLRIAAALDPVLEARDILTDLINHGQLLGKRQQPRIRRKIDLTHRRGAGCDESGINLRSWLAASGIWHRPGPEPAETPQPQTACAAVRRRP